MEIVTFAYDGGYEPSAPVIEIGVGPADGAPARLTVLALVDSGADGTVLPEAALQQAGARYVQHGVLPMLGHMNSVEPTRYRRWIGNAYEKW